MTVGKYFILKLVIFLPLHVLCGMPTEDSCMTFHPISFATFPLLLVSELVLFCYNNDAIHVL